MNSKINLNTSLKHFPFSTFQKFCDVIIPNVWEQIAAKIMNRAKTALRFTYDDICSFRRSRNPAEEMMNAWKMDNPKFSDLMEILEKETLLRAVTFVQENVLEVKTNCKNTPKFYSQNSTVVIDNAGNCDTEKLEREKEELSKTINSYSYKIDYQTLSRWTNNFNHVHHHYGGNFIDSGGFADVFVGMKKGEKVAVKKFKKMDLKDQFENEKILFSLNHPNLVKLLHRCDDGPSLCLVYEFVHNGSLLNCLCHVETVATLDSRTRVKVARQTAAGLNYLHNNNIVHRDIKSANILLTHDMDAKIGDFGISKVLDLSGDTHVTTRTVVGTVVYMAPEYLFSQKVSPPIDMYSFGVVLLELTYGQPAYSEERKTRNIIEMFEEEECVDECWRDSNENGVVEIMHGYITKLLRKKKDLRPTAEVTLKALTDLEAIMFELLKK